MKIVHISDLHNRNLKFHDDYRRVYENFYRKMDEIRPDLIINTGDTGHTKTQISPEFVDIVSEHLVRTSEYAPYHLILGNHDLNLMNLERQDSISPIVKMIESNRIFLHKKSGPVHLPDFNLTFWVFSLADVANYPTAEQWKEYVYAQNINVGLFHGSISDCVVDSNWRMTNAEHQISIFDGLDYVLMGDIHKQQFFRDRTIAYAGSLIQQNFGEDIDKGFLVWNITGKKSHAVTSHVLEGARKFHTVHLNGDLSLPDIGHIQADSRVRVVPPRDITLSEHKEIESRTKNVLNPHDVIILSSVNIGQQISNIESPEQTTIENLRDLTIQESLIKEFFGPKDIGENVRQKIFELNKTYQVKIDAADSVSRNIEWKIGKMEWDNLFNYGQGNVIDFEKLGGLTGIFAPNSAGKSSLIDVILETIYDSTTRGISKNIHLINDNKETAHMRGTLFANGAQYLIDRKIDRIKTGKGGTGKEWGKTSCEFTRLNDVDGQTLTGQSRPETERAIRSRFGSYEDFLITSLSAQWNPLDIISAKETKRKEIFFKFLDLNFFEEKVQMAKEEAKIWNAQLKELEDDDLDHKIEKSIASLLNLNLFREEQEAKVSFCDEKIKELSDEMMSLNQQKSPVEDAQDKSLLEKQILALNTLITKDSVTLQDLVDDLEKKNESAGILIESIKSFDSAYHADRVRELQTVNKKIRDLEQLLNLKKQDVIAKKKSVSLLREVPCGNEFPTCKFLVNSFESKNTLPVLENNIAIDEKELTACKDTKEDLEKSVQSLEKFEKMKGDLKEQQSTLQNILLKIENVRLQIEANAAKKETTEVALQKSLAVDSLIAQNLKIDEKISSLRKQRTDFEKDLATERKSLDTLNQKIGSENASLDVTNEHKKRLTEVREMCLVFERYIEVMGKDGIPLQILARQLPLINEQINKILMNAADFSVQIDYDNDEQSIRIYIQYGQYKSRLIELAGGAEKMIASLALRTALLNISNLPKADLFIVDEGFGKLDPKNLENVDRMFDYLRTVFNHVLVISHLEVLKDMVDNVIEITTDDEGYAHVEIGERHEDSDVQ